MSYHLSQWLRPHTHVICISRKKYKYRVANITQHSDISDSEDNHTHLSLEVTREATFEIMYKEKEMGSWRRLGVVGVPVSKGQVRTLVLIILLLLDSLFSCYFYELPSARFILVFAFIFVPEKKADLSLEAFVIHLRCILLNYIWPFAILVSLSLVTYLNFYEICTRFNLC